MLSYFHDGTRKKKKISINIVNNGSVRAYTSTVRDQYTPIAKHYYCAQPASAIGRTNVER